MKTWVCYYSKGGNTKKIADAIAEELNIQQSEQIPPAYPLEDVGLLFLGTAEYAGQPDPKMVEFIRTLTTKRVKNVVVFGTSGSGEIDGKAINIVKNLIKQKGINVLDETYACKGKFFVFMNRRKPDKNDIQGAKAFARKVYESMKV